MPRIITPPNPTAEALVDIAQKAEPEIIAKVARVNKASNGPADKRENVERGLQHFDVLEADNERLKRELSEARERVHLLEIQIEEIEGTRTTIESRINSCVLERDNAVREAGELRGALNSVAAICVRYHNEHQE